MRTSKPLKTVERAIEQLGDKVDEYWIEGDDYLGEESPFSYWIYLSRGWNNGDPGSHIIHEGRAADILDRIRWIDRCTCEQCEAKQ